MAVTHNLDQSFVDTQLQCPPGKVRHEFVDPQRTGLYVEVRAGTPGRGTFYVRYKSGGKTCHHNLGRTTDLTLQQAREAAATFKASLSPSPIPKAPVRQVAAESVSIDRAPESGITLDSFWTDNYLPHAKIHKRSWKRDEQLYRRIKQKFGHLPLSGIKRLAVEQFQHSLLLDEKLSAATANQHVVLFRRVLSLAVQWEMVDKNVLTRIQLFPLDNQVEHYLDEEQVANLVQVLKTDDNRAVCWILLFLLSPGARKSEALMLEWKHVDLENRTWRIPSRKSKSKKAKTLPLNDSAVWVLQQLDSEGRSPYVFPSPATGKPFTEITRVWYRLRKKAGLPATRIHDLRHTFASRLVSCGRSLFDVQMLLGHADPRTSMRYAHISPKAMQEASNAAALNLA